MSDVLRQASATPVVNAASPTNAFTTPASTGRLGARIVWAILFFMPLAVVITSAFLVPSPAGIGTHTQLGLPPCGFYEWTGLPCPGCGLTTCFAHMVRGQFISAAHANAFGVLLFLVTVASMPISFLGMLRGLSVTAVLERLSIDKLALILAMGSLTVWCVRLFTIFATR